MQFRMATRAGSRGIDGTSVPLRHLEIPAAQAYLYRRAA
jgi:hypothetical protein